MRHTTPVLLVLLSACSVMSVSCLAGVDTAEDTGGAGSATQDAPTGEFVGLEMMEIAEHLGVALEGLSDCESGCLAFGREGCHAISAECEGHENDDDELVYAPDGLGGTYVTECPNALAIACGGYYEQHRCMAACRGRSR